MAKDNGLRLKVAFKMEPCDRGSLLRVQETGQILLLNRTAAHVMAGLEKGQDRHALVTGLTDAFEVPDEQAAEDVNRCLLELVTLGIIENESF